MNVSISRLSLSISLRIFRYLYHLWFRLIYFCILFVIQFIVAMFVFTSFHPNPFTIFVCSHLFIIHISWENPFGYNFNQNRCYCYSETGDRSLLFIVHCEVNQWLLSEGLLILNVKPFSVKRNYVIKMDLVRSSLFYCFLQKVFFCPFFAFSSILVLMLWCPSWSHLHKKSQSEPFL